MLSTIIAALTALAGVSLGSFITWKIYTRDRLDKYTFAGLEDKIRIHQEAFDLCWDLPSTAHRSDEDDTYLIKCQDWYRKNCLYLEPEARKAFYAAYSNAWNYKLYLMEWKSTGKCDELKNKWTEIVSAISVIERNISKPLFEPVIPKNGYDFKGKLTTE